MSGSLRPIEHKNTQEYWEIPESKNDSQKYPIVYLISPTRPEPDQLPGICFNTRLALVSNCYSWKTWWSSHDKYFSHHLYGAAQNDLKTLVVVNHGFNFVGNYHRPIWQTQVVGLSIILVIDTELFPPKFNQVDVNIADTGSLGDTIILSKPESLKNVMNWL